MAYSQAFRERMVRRLLGPPAISARALSQEVGVSQQTLSRWLRDASTVGPMAKRKSKNGAKRRPQDWPAEEKMAAVLEAGELEEEALGRFLRERGLHRATLERWREQMLQGLAPGSGRRKKSPEARRVRELERELRHKEKALAEASALLVLKKKAAAIWGDEDDDTPPRSGR